MVSTETNCLLKLSNSDYLVKFLHECVDDLIGRKYEIGEVYNSDIEWTGGETLKARTLVQNLYKRATYEENFEPSVAGLSARDLNEIKECFQIRKEEIYQAVVKERLLQSEHPLVENIDWKLKWVMGSSRLASISEPLLQLDLHCYKNSGGRSTINFEMNPEQLDRFISELELAKSKLKK